MRKLPKEVSIRMPFDVYERLLELLQSAQDLRHTYDTKRKAEWVEKELKDAAITGHYNDV